MSTISEPDLFADSLQPRVTALHCPACGTDTHLTIHSIDSAPLPAAGLVNVTYTCERCGDLHTEEASVAQVAAILNRPGPVAAAEVLQFGGQYIHCGEPMHAAGSELRSVYAPATTEVQAAAFLEVYLSTRVLRCSCGFQMEIPQ
jgi:uncharacterized Zn finger protein